MTAATAELLCPLKVAAGLQGVDGKPLVYPMPLFVRNTFIDTGNARPASLDEFIPERRVVSCPNSAIDGMDDGLFDPDPEEPQPVMLQRSKTAGAVLRAEASDEVAQERRAMVNTDAVSAMQVSGVEPDKSSECSTVDSANEPVFRPRNEESNAWSIPLEDVPQCPPAIRMLPMLHSRHPELHELPSPPKHPPQLVQQHVVPPFPQSLPPRSHPLPPPPLQPPQIAQLEQVHFAQAPPMPVVDAVSLEHELGMTMENPAFGFILGSEALPSRGSISHYGGDCKPCAFMHSKGCKTGAECQFCHLCEAGEKKRRQKEKRAFFSTMRQIRQFVGGGASDQE